MVNTTAHPLNPPASLSLNGVALSPHTKTEDLARTESISSKGSENPTSPSSSEEEVEILESYPASAPRHIHSRSPPQNITTSSRIERIVDS
ncbi:uncharacterized protein I303_100274 [Kwoniella dejecticola CBS 10117]|uniref:Uncharacterized protein n=1 Tax=Kwoniella dejecticola CBS 10117 TaxID=1296121 RepID=A0A1A6AEK3_9TREE|nr:uncharacterized protein I303_00275 [Kwoniella dejecticola CBS 10117]OBR88458.1 hypothetical protein I303_00275 [Kwoniella dejecticola CBS 10117]